MDTLFSLKPVLPPGFFYFENFLTQHEETELFLAISKINLHTFTFQGYEAKRKVASFGYDYNFEKKSLSKGAQIPSSFEDVIRKVADTLSMNKEDFGELLITEYPVGSVINWHRDAFPFDVIAGISLGSDCVFRLRPHDKTERGRNKVISLPVRQRSLYVIQDAARMEWEHSIAPVKKVRHSITLRTIKNM